MPDCEIGDGSLTNATSPNHEHHCFRILSLSLLVAFSADTSCDLTVFESHFDAFDNVSVVA